MRTLRKAVSVLIILGTISNGVHATDFCKRLPMDPEVPAGLDGSYEIVGRNSASGVAYTGTLVLGIGRNSYAVTRTTDRGTVNGDAWMESCGIDKVKALIVRYYTKPVTEMHCTFTADGDNYYRATCRTHQIGRQKFGLEAWFQNH